MNTAKKHFILNSSGGAVGFDSDYQAYLDRATTLGFTLPTEAHQTLGNQLVLSLKEANIWSSLDVFWVPAIDNVNLAKLNWKAPASFQLTAGISSTFPPFTANQGFIGDLTNYAKTGWIPATHGVNYQQDNASMTVATIAEANALYSPSGFSNGTSHWAYMLPRFSGSAFTRINSLSSAAVASAVVASSIGFYLAQRTTSTTIRLFKNGSQIAINSSSSSSGLSTSDAYVEAYNNGTGAANRSTQGVSFLAYGDSLAGKESDFYTIWNTYYTGL